MDDPSHRADLGRLTDRLAAGEGAAFAELFDLLGERLYRAARRIVVEPHDAEDAVQELFIALVRGRQHLRNVDDLTAYVFASLLRLAARIRSRRLKTLPIADNSALPAPMVARFDDDAEELALAMKALPDEQRAVVALKVDGGLTFAQIGAALDISPNTAASRWRYALETLRKTMSAKEQRP